jgi:predicted enzyme related to lactoylglutathione lyase
MSLVKNPARRTVAKSTRPAQGPDHHSSRPSKPATPGRWTRTIRDLGLVSIIVGDWERAKEFYGETLGLPVARAMDDMGWIEYGFPNQSHVAIMRWNRPEPMPTASPTVIPVFTCYDVRAAHEELTSKGVRCDPVVEIPGVVLYADLYDPDGNRLELAQSIMSGE